jgi:hypothetical protein
MLATLSDEDMWRGRGEEIAREEVMILLELPVW